MKYPLAAFAIFLTGFGIAWWVKPAEATAATSSPPPRPRTERPTRQPTTKPATDAFFQRMEEAGYRKDKRTAVLDEVIPAEIPTLLAELQTRGGMGGLSYTDRELVDELVMTWSAKAPDAALAWVLALRNDSDRHGFLGKIAMKLAATDLDGALALLRQHSTPKDNLISLNYGLMQIALNHGEDKLLEICRETLHANGDSTSGTTLSYPAGFDFKRTLDGLVQSQAAIGEKARYGTIPMNLLSEWAGQDSRAAWEWLQQGKKLTFNGTPEFFKGYAKAAKPDEVGSFLGSTFDPSVIPSDRYEPLWEVLYGDYSSPEILDSFLKEAPGDRTKHLNDLFDQSRYSSGTSIEKARTMILERMDPATRVEALRRVFDGHGANEDTRSALTPVLRRLGHGEEEIQTMLPPRKE